ncbi:histidine kinase [Coraliomargarita sp. SDUM461003]|uniref:histidine kinase n=1 Tax=Thalassobacterium maritimum TaxID=3041265 RepID=A0ABU1AW83_9BACT|nr:histidine kinase [Coraliomargarita sp. SDUM461003]MDQ8207395.1 histidine kinase [Coraliomargarita sp. SDUM461003]
MLSVLTSLRLVAVDEINIATEAHWSDSSVKNPESFDATAKQLAWEREIANRLLKSYRENENRLREIEAELDTLPIPYGGEPTGSGGYLTAWQKSALKKTQLNFTWDKTATIDAIALVPLRLYLGDEAGLTENAYWPGSIKIRAKVNGAWKILAELNDSQQEIQNSLPEFVSFDPIQTQECNIVFSNLPKRMGNNQYAGGFSEIFIFSTNANIAPRAKITVNSSREGYRVFSRDYLTDEQTPLGLPEIGPRTAGGLGLTIVTKDRIHSPARSFTIKYPEDQKIDGVRIDPAVIYKPGQAFPIRFTVQLLDAAQNILQSNERYLDTPFRNPGLNPHIVHFPPTTARSVRLNFIESSQPTERSRPWIQISEVTPLYRGVPLPRTAKITATQENKPRIAQGLSDPFGIQLFWSNQAAYDGMTQSGKILTHREWLKGLNLRLRLLEEKSLLTATQTTLLHKVRNYSLMSTIGLTLLIIFCALYLTIHHRMKVKREIRDTRERIASDLHDDVGSNLGTINLHTEFLMDQIEEAELTDRLKAIFKLTKESAFGLREVLHTTAPRIGRAQNIVPHIEELTQLSLFDIEYSLQLDPTINKTLTSPLLRKGLLLYYKEALYNIQHHAQCTQVTISLKEHLGRIELKISDNGIGMSKDQLAAPSTLRTLKLRAKDLNGALKIQSQPNQGMTLRLTISPR